MNIDITPIGTLTSDQEEEDVVTPSERKQLPALPSPTLVTPPVTHPTQYPATLPVTASSPILLVENGLKCPGEEEEEKLYYSAEDVSGDSALEDEMFTRSEDNETFSASPPVVRRAVSVDGSLLRSADGTIASPKKLTLRRISLGKAEHLITAEDLKQCKPRFVPPPPPEQVSCHRPRANNVTPVYYNKNEHRSWSIPSDISSTTERTGDKDDLSDNNESDSSTEASDLEEDQDQLTESNSAADCMIVGEALWDHASLRKDHLEFKAGDLIEVLHQKGRWWKGRNDSGKTGWFPGDSIRLRVSQEADDQDLKNEAKLAPRRMTILQRMNTMSGKPKLNPDWVRQKVIEEIINYEEGYVKNLRDVIEGPLKEARLRNDLFDEAKIERLFSNIEELHQFQVKFVEQLKKRLHSVVYKSQIGDTFTENHDLFVDIYSRYCNNHSSALAEYTLLNQHMVYAIFFESCRLLKDMESIPLDGYLLKPVQRICQYQLQLKELSKYTSHSHPDFAAVREAESIMKRVASTVNERKRRIENIKKLAKWQSTIEDWRGEDILVTSSILLFSGSLYKISAGNKQLRRFFLFDRQLVYCRKLLGSGKLQYKGRICLDQCKIEESVADPSLSHAWRIENTAKHKWVVLLAKKSSDKDRWLAALREERQQIQDDEANNFTISQHLRQAAYVQVLHENNREQTRTRKINSLSQIKYKSTSNLKDHVLIEEPTVDLRQKDKKSKGFSNKLFVRKQKKMT